MRLLQWIANTCMASCEDLFTLPFQSRGIKVHLHQFIHILHGQHVAIQLHHSIILHQTERCQFGPAIVEARVSGVVLAILREKVLDALLGNSPSFESGMSLSWKRIGVECYEWVLGFMFFKAVVQGKEAREVFCVGDESCPYCFESVVHYIC
jgi:hypothetical protein